MGRQGSGVQVLSKPGLLEILSQKVKPSMVPPASNSTIWRCKQVDQGHPTLAWPIYLKVVVVGEITTGLYEAPKFLRNIKIIDYHSKNSFQELFSPTLFILSPRKQKGIIKELSHISRVGKKNKIFYSYISCRKY